MSKPVDDKKLSLEQFENRKKKHPQITETPTDVKTGDHVFLKVDGNKLKGRETYKVINTYQVGDEKWADLLKSEGHLRKKIYRAKFQELFLVPYSNVKASPQPKIQPERIQDVDTDSNKCLDPNVSHNNKLSETRPMKKQRLSAVKAKKKISELVKEQVVLVKEDAKQKSTHGWDWNTYNELLQEEHYISLQPNYTSSAKHTHESATMGEDSDPSIAKQHSSLQLSSDSSNEKKLSWNNSPEQYETSFSYSYSNNRLDNPQSRQGVDTDTSFRRRLDAFNMSEDIFQKDSLTSSDTQEDAFFSIDVPTLQTPNASNFHRQSAVRRRKNKRRNSSKAGSRHSSVIKCPRRGCSTVQYPSKCPADLTTDYDGEFSGQTMVIRRSKRQIPRINNSRFNETGAKEVQDGDTREGGRDKMVTE